MRNDTAWEMARIEVRREYRITDAPDLQDASSPRRRVIRPCEVVLHQVYGTNLVLGATIEGRQVRRDGELGARRNILAGCSRRFGAAPPNWLNVILDDEGLEWDTRG